MTESYVRLRDAIHTAGLKIEADRQNSLKAQCPSHDDGKPSLSVTASQDRVLVRCHAGCHTDDIVTALGLELSDLFDTKEAATPDNAVVVRSYVYETGMGKPWLIKDRYMPKSFALRLPGTEPGAKSGLKGREPVLYRLPKVDRAIKAGEPIWIVEGEKDVEACERHGLTATTQAFGAGPDKWLPRYTESLAGAKEVVIVEDADEKGQNYAQAVRASLRAAGIRAMVVRSATGKDAFDHFAAGHGVDEFLPSDVATRPRGMTAERLMGVEFPELIYAVEDLLPAGLGILAGSPKAGKSWTALSFALGVAAGGRAMSSLPCTQGSVLYLAREDGYRRLQSRLDLLLQGDDREYLKYLEIIPAEETWHGGEEGLAAMSEWADEVDSPRLVILDTIAKVEPQLDDRDRYRSDYSMMAGYKKWADQHNATVLAVHHDRKAAADDGDPFTRISGTRGLTGAADTLLFLETKRGTKEGLLHVTGRDVAEQSIDLMKVGPLWQAISLVESIKPAPRSVPVAI